MKLKIRGKDYDFINDFLSDKEVDILIGKDVDGNEVYTGDTVVDTENGGEYRADLSLDLNYLPFDSCISNFRLVDR